jgi:hypothetical protein
MSTLPQRTATALLIIDVQVGVVGAAYQRDTVIANIKRSSPRRAHPARP